MSVIKDFGALIGIAIAAIGGAISYGSLKADVAQSRADSAALSARVDKHDDKIGEQSTGIAVLKTEVDAIKDGIDRIEDRMGTKPR